MYTHAYIYIQIYTKICAYIYIRIYMYLCVYQTKEKNLGLFLLLLRFYYEKYPQHLILSLIEFPISISNDALKRQDDCLIAEYLWYI